MNDNLLTLNGYKFTAEELDINSDTLIDVNTKDDVKLYIKKYKLIINVYKVANSSSKLDIKATRQLYMYVGYIPNGDIIYSYIDYENRGYNIGLKY